MGGLYNIINNINNFGVLRGLLCLVIYIEWLEPEFSQDNVLWIVQKR